MIAELQATPSCAAKRPGMPSTAQEQITLRLLDGERTDCPVWETTNQLLIGRLPKCDIVLDDTAVSRYHAEVVKAVEGWMLRDLGSTNGTFLNGTRVSRAEVALQVRDIIQIGEKSLLVAAIQSHGSMTQSGHAGLEVVEFLKCSWQELLERQEADSGSALAAIAKIGRRFYSAESIDSFLENTLWEVAELFNAQHGAFVVRDEQSQKLAVRAVFSMGDRTRAEDCSYLAMAEWALAQERTMLCRPLSLAGADASGPAATTMLGFLGAHDCKLGVLILARGGDQEPFASNDLRLAETLSQCLSNSIYSFDRQSLRNRNLLIQTLTTLTRLLNLKNSCARDYTDKAADYALLIASELDVSEGDKYLLKIGTPLRDLGNIGVPDAILEKPGALTPPETFLLKSHVTKGVALLESIPFLVPLVPMVRGHHERWDGSGYPDGVSGVQIPLLSRIIAVADALDAMISPRPFRKAMSLDAAFAEIRDKSGSQFDPDCVQALLRARERIEEVHWNRRLLPETFCWDRVRSAVAGSPNAQRPNKA